LGMIQGLTEFLPVSSSGHLVVFEHILKVKMPGASFEACLHLGTFVSVVLVYRKKLYTMAKAVILKIHSLFCGKFNEAYKGEWEYSYLIVLGTIPAGILGLTLKDKIESSFFSVSFVGAMLVITGMVLWFSGLAKSKKENISLLDAITIGLAQGFALLPGISRSGMTITCGMFLGIEKPKAAEFSFLLSLPAILGASVIEFSDLSLNQNLSLEQLVFYLVGGLVACVSGYVAIKLLLRIIQKGKFKYFGFYCFGLGGLVFLLSR